MYVTYSEQEAYIVAGRLQHEDIPAMVHKEAGAAALGIHIGALGEVKVLVRAEDYDDAIAILDPEQPDSLPDLTGNIILRHFDESDDDANE